MKAWYAYNSECSWDDGGLMVWAATRGQAKAEAFKQSRDVLFEDFREVRIHREPKADGNPHEPSGEEWLRWGYWTPCCWCRDLIEPESLGVVFQGTEAWHAACVK